MRTPEARWRWQLRDLGHRLRSNVYGWLAYHLPRELVSACGWRQWAHAVDGRWKCKQEEACALTCEEVQLRWFQKP